MTPSPIAVLSERELAAQLGISYWTIRELRLRQGLPHFQCGRKVLYRLATVLEWIEQQEYASTQRGSAPANDSPIRQIQ